MTIMKKYIITTAVALLATAMLFAQPRGGADHKPSMTPEQRFEFKANDMASKLFLSDEVASDFKPMYKAYCKELMEINARYRPAVKKGGEGDFQPRTDKEIDQAIRAGFDKSQDILDLRKAYYEKFSKILTARQISEMYKLEKSWGHMGNRHGNPRDMQMPKRFPHRSGK